MCQKKVLMPQLRSQQQRDQQTKKKTPTKDHLVQPTLQQECKDERS